MKTSLIAGAAIALSLAASSCLANPSHAEDAQDLRADLAALPGVQEVALSYVEPVPLDSGKLEFKVRMQPHASPQQARKVVATTYAAFRGTHAHEEGDLAPVSYTHLTLPTKRIV